MLAATPLPSAWKHWRYSRAIDLSAPAGATGARPGMAQLVGLLAPPDLYAHAQTGLADLRLIDDQGREVPYVIFQRVGSSKSATLPATLRENSFSAGAFTQLVLDAGAHAPFHNSVEIKTGEADFIEWVEGEARDAGNGRRRAGGGGPIC